MVIAVTSMPNRCLSFQVIFTGCETDDTDEQNVTGGAMWARLPITALVGDTPVDDWAKELPPYLAQPWDCMSHDHSVYVLNRATPAPWIVKVDGEFYPGTFKFVDDDDRLDEGHLVITLKKDTAPWEDVMHIEDGWVRY